MRIDLFLAAILIITFGHCLRARRWAGFIMVYEDVKYADIIRSMFFGYTADIIMPFHSGDLIRALYIGKKLTNKTAFALATIIIDRLLDVFMVAVIYFIFYVTGSSQCLYNLIFYAAASVLLAVFCGWALMFNRTLKKLILAVSSVFNEKIQLEILAFSWAGICTIKNILGGINKLKLFINTLLIWLCYVLAYLTLAASMNSVNTLDIFNVMFSAAENNKFIIPMVLLFNVLTCVCLFIVSVLCGIFGKKSHGIETERIIPYISENGRLDFLKIYFSNIRDRNYITEFLELNKDATIIKNCSAGSNATTLLCIKNNDMLFRKYALGDDGEKLYAQVKWLRDNADKLPVTKILKVEKKETSCCYDMAYDSAAIDFFSYIHSVPEQQAWNILSCVIDDLEKNYEANISGKANRETIKNYLDKKVFANLSKITSASPLKQVLDGSSIIINTKEYKNLSVFMDKLTDAEFWINIFADDYYSDIHGDLTVENIIYSEEYPKKYYLIDPNGGNIHDSPELDYAKLMQSLHGSYEFLMHTYDVTVSKNNITFLMSRSLAYDRLYKRYREYLRAKLGEKRLKSIYFHEIIHWLRLMPYKINNDSSRAPMFYAGMITVINNIFEEFVND